MATLQDATLSIYYYINQFIDHLTTVSDLPQFTLAVTTSLESANTLLMDGTNKLILVQTKTTIKHFHTFEYKLFVSFAQELDVNAMLTVEVLSAFEGYFPKYSSLIIYNGENLKLPQSILTDTGTKLVVVDVKQSEEFTPRMRNNLIATVFKLTGYLC